MNRERAGKKERGERGESTAPLSSPARDIYQFGFGRAVGGSKATLAIYPASLRAGRRGRQLKNQQTMAARFSNRKR